MIDHLNAAQNFAYEEQAADAISDLVAVSTELEGAIENVRNQFQNAFTSFTSQVSLLNAGFSELFPQLKVVEEKIENVKPASYIAKIEQLRFLISNQEFATTQLQAQIESAQRRNQVLEESLLKFKESNLELKKNHNVILQRQQAQQENINVVEDLDLLNDSIKTIESESNDVLALTNELTQRTAVYYSSHLGHVHPNSPYTFGNYNGTLPYSSGPST